MSDAIRVLVVDDEPLARERVRALLEKEPGFIVTGECSDGMEALECIRRDRPDLVFLDIQMPEMDGLSVLGALEPGMMPEVVFVTAYDRYAIKAFELHALDYLLKPFDNDRFATTLERVRERMRRPLPPDEVSQRLTALLAELRPTPKTADRLAVKSGGRVVLVRVEDVDWVESADNYVSLHVGAETHLLRETMNALEARLPLDRFVRVSRSTIVNLDRVKELQPLFHGEYAVILRDGVRLTLSRGYREKLDLLMGRE